MPSQLTNTEQKLALGMWNIPAHLLKKGVRVSCTEIALAIYKHRQREKRRKRLRRAVKRPDKATVWRLVTGRSHENDTKKKKKNGPAPSLLEVTIRKIPKIIEKLEKMYPDDDVTAEMVTAELAVRIRAMNRKPELYPRQKLPRPRTVQKYIYKSGRRARRNRQKPSLSDAHKVARKVFSRWWKRKTPQWWQRYCVTTDEKTFHWFGTPSGQLAQRGKGKKFSYRLPSEGLKFSTPSVSRHFQGGVSVNVLCVIAQGRVIVWKYYAGPLKAKTWAALLHRTIAPAMGTLDNLGRLRLLRDDAPQSHHSNLGRETEQLLGINTLVQPSNSPDMQPCDYSIWAMIAKKMKAQERRWQKKHPTLMWKEKLKDYKIRLRKTAFRLTRTQIDRVFAHMPKVLAAIDAANGGHAKCD